MGYNFAMFKSISRYNHSNSTILGGGLIYNNAMHRFRLLKLASPPDARLGHFSLKGNAYQQSGLLEHRKKAFLYMPCSQQTAVEITNVPFNDFYHEDTNDT